MNSYNGVEHSQNQEVSITDIDTKPVGEMENVPDPDWNIGAKDILPHIMWKYTSDDVNASND